MSAQSKTTVKDFKVVKRLGKGAFGEVYKVQRISDGEVYAMKKINISRCGRRLELSACGLTSAVFLQNVPS